MSETTGKDCLIKISGQATTMTAEATDTSDNQIYQIHTATKRVLDRYTVPTVYDGGVQTIEDYTINYLNGKITFSTVDADRVITISGKYVPLTTAAYAYEASHSKAVDIHEVTPFQVTHKKRKAGLKSASGSLSDFNIEDMTYENALTAGVPVVLEIRAINTEEPSRYWILLNQKELSAAVSGMQNQKITWVSYDSWLRLGV